MTELCPNVTVTHNSIPTLYHIMYNSVFKWLIKVHPDHAILVCSVYISGLSNINLKIFDGPTSELKLLDSFYCRKSKGCWYFSKTISTTFQVFILINGAFKYESDLLVLNYKVGR